MQVKQRLVFGYDTDFDAIDMRKEQRNRGGVGIIAMQRMILLIGRLLVGTSAVMCVLICVLWARSYWRIDTIGRNIGITHQVLNSWDGEFRYFRRTGFATGGTGWSIGTQRHLPYVAMQPPQTWLGKAGFYYVTDAWSTHANPSSAWDRYAGAPHWFLALLTAMVPAIWFIRGLRRHRRGRAGYCPACGYDLRATPRRCPECGREISGRGIMTIDGRCP